MNQSIVRLQEINISNLKKVKSGDAAFPSYKREEFFSRESDILAMFGQEGNGRSSLVNALLILKNILLGDPFFDDIEDYIWDDTRYFDINYKFSVEVEEDQYLISYRIYYDKADSISLKEYISRKKVIDDGFKRKRSFKIDYPEEESDNIFSADFQEIEVSNFDNEDFREIVSALKNYARNDLNVFRNDIKLPILNSDLVKLKEMKDVETKELNYLVAYDYSIISQNNLISNMEKLTYNISRVLGETFPNISVNAKEVDEKVINIELFSKDKSKLLKDKSKEINNLISIMIVLLPMIEKTSACVAVDKLEIDKIGDFKFKLAELIKNEAKGQMVIITNDFKFLNQLGNESLIYTTWNPKNRYKKFERITSIDDTREFYYRSLYIKSRNKKLKKAH
jgi:hypothetical protein